MADGAVDFKRQRLARLFVRCEAEKSRDILSFSRPRPRMVLDGNVLVDLFFFGRQFCALLSRVLPALNPLAGSGRSTRQQDTGTPPGVQKTTLLPLTRLAVFLLSPLQK